MLNSLKGLLITLRTTLRRPVTAQYPKTHLPVQDRFMGFPALTWDEDVGEPYCVGCMVCIRECPTQCMSATMVDNPLFADKQSKRRKIVGDFEINLGRCIICGICVDVCNFEAIVMSHEHEISTYGRYARRADLPRLLEMGKRHQEKTGWTPPSKAAKAAAPAPQAAAQPAQASAEAAQAPAQPTQASAEAAQAPTTPAEEPTP